MIFTNFKYEFNSLIEMNSYGGNVVIKNSEFSNINTCGALIRNKVAILDKSSQYTPATGYDDYYTYFLARSNRFLYELYTSIYTTTFTSPFAGCTET